VLGDAFVVIGPRAVSSGPRRDVVHVDEADVARGRCARPDVRTMTSMRAGAARAASENMESLMALFPEDKVRTSCLQI